MSQDRLKTRVQFASTLKKELAEELDKLHKKTLIPKSKLLDKAVELLLKEFKPNS